MKFCQNCGAELNDAAKFCDKCGSKVASFEEPKKEQPIREGVVHKCPFCGEILPSNVGRCPTCGHEIRGREVLNSIKELTSKLDATDDDIKKIEIIKTFPIPSNKEDIMEQKLEMLQNRYHLDFAGNLDKIFHGVTLYKTIEYMRKHI